MKNRSLASDFLGKNPKNKKLNWCGLIYIQIIPLYHYYMRGITFIWPVCHIIMIRIIIICDTGMVPFYGLKIGPKITDMCTYLSAWSTLGIRRGKHFILIPLNTIQCFYGYILLKLNLSKLSSFIELFHSLFWIKLKWSVLCIGGERVNIPCMAWHLNLS